MALLVSWGFDPRLRVGGDDCQGYCGDSERVSIHASAWEATPHPWKPRQPRWSFDPRLRVGGDYIHPVTAGALRMFRSTPPRGRRPPRRQYLRISEKFRSTPPRGRRHQAKAVVEDVGPVSIHASAWEATVDHVAGGEDLRFRSTPPRGRRLAGFTAKAIDLRFRSTPPRGRRHVRDVALAGDNLFRSTPPRGRRPPIRWAV